MSMLRYMALSDSSRNECTLISEQYSWDSLLQASAQTSRDFSSLTAVLSDYSQDLSLVYNIISFLLGGLFI